MKYAPEILFFTVNGTVELRTRDDAIIYSSADDPHFEKNFGEEADPDDDEKILEYLVTKGTLTDSQADDIEIIVDGDDEDDDENEEDDEP